MSSSSKFFRSVPLRKIDSVIPTSSLVLVSIIISAVVAVGILTEVIHLILIGIMALCFIVWLHHQVDNSVYTLAVIIFLVAYFFFLSGLRYITVIGVPVVWLLWQFGIRTQSWRLRAASVSPVYFSDFNVSKKKNSFASNLIWIWFASLMLVIFVLNPQSELIKRVLFAVLVFSVLGLYYTVFPRFLMLPQLYNHFIHVVFIVGVAVATVGLLMTFVLQISVLRFGSLYLGLINEGFSSLPFISSSIYHHPNSTALVYLIAIPVGMLLLTRSRPQYHTPSLRLLVAFCVLLIGEILTYSRSSYIGLIVSISFLLYYRIGKKVFVFIVVLLPIVLYFLGGFFAAKGTGSSNSRAILYFIASNLIFSSPTSLYFGVGVDGYEIFTAEKELFGINDTAPSPHNVYVFLALQFGILTTAIFIGFLIVTFTRGVIWLHRHRNARYSEPHYETMLIFTALLLGISVHQLFEDTIQLFNNFFSFAFIISCGVIHLISDHTSVSPKPDQQRLLR